MSTPQYFRINSPKYIHEIIEDEVIVANLEDGLYYSIDKVGVVIWNGLDAGASTAQIIDLLKQHFGSNNSEIREAVVGFLTELEQEGLIIPDPSRQEDNCAAVSFKSAILDSNFEKPRLNKYTDMQQILLLDPIHEVDETGWPNAAAQPVKN